MTLTAERPLMPENEPISNGTEGHLGQLSLEQQIIYRGDRQLPEEPDRGFRIERLEGGSEHNPVPLKEAFPGTKAEDFAQQIMDGSTQVQIVEHSTEHPGGFMVFFRVPGSKYREAVASGAAEDGLFGAEGKVSRTKPGTEALDALVDDDQKRTALEKYFEQQAHTVQENYINDLDTLGAGDKQQLEGLFGAYELSDGGRDMRLLNFTRTELSEEQLRQAASVIRSVSDKSGGELFDRLRTILILPEDNPRISHTAQDEKGESFKAPYAAGASGTSLIVSERAIQRPEDRKPRPERVDKYWDNFYEPYRLPGEPKEGPGSPKRTAGGFEWETLLAHELEHIALPPNSVELPGPGPTLYSRKTKREHEAELGAIEYEGGEQALAVPEDQRQAKQEMWRQQRGSDDGGQTYKQPLGPRFVVCREIDLSQGPLPARLKHPNRPLATEINYRLVPEA